MVLNNPEIWIGFATLTLLEIVLGIDNLIFISLLTARLPIAQQKPARLFGLALACGTRLLLLGMITWLTRLTLPLFYLFGHAFSGRDLILISGGVFLLAKSTSEIHIEAIEREEKSKHRAYQSFFLVLVQIAILDIIFSLDSVITAVGLAQHFIVMAGAILVAVGLMMIASTPLSRFIHTYPSIKTLALSFLLLIGAILVADGFGFYMPRGYLYFAIAFSLLVECLNILTGKRSKK